MSTLDKIISAVTPPESEDQRRNARSEARAAAKPGDWLSMVLDHHLRIEEAFAAVRAAPDAGQRRAAQKILATLLTGHSMAEEAVIYPAMAQEDEKGAAGTAYTEQTAAKMQMAALEVMDPMSEDYLDKLGHLEGAVKHHVFEEEGKWFPQLVEKLSSTDSVRVTARYQEEFNRYMGPDAEAQGRFQASGEPRSFSTP